MRSNWLQASITSFLVAGALSGCGGSSSPKVENTSTYPLITSTTDTGDGSSGDDGSGDGTSPTPTPAPYDTVTVSGNAQFEFVPATASAGLNYSAMANRPIRGAIVDAIDVSSNTVVSRVVTDELGNYSVAVPTNTQIFIRVRAQVYRSGTPSWDVRVVDNTRSQGSYVLDGSPFTTSDVDITGKNMVARSGWSGSAYTSPRNAAPFAILDVIYQNIQKVVSVDSSVALPQLLVNWSTKNVPSDGDKTLGQIVTTNYDLDGGQMYVLGAQGVDTDEYDRHVIAHEWMHYFEQKLSRSDSIGGSHTITSKLDPRVAFSEGLANAFSGISNANPIYVDTAGTQQATTQITFDLSSSTLAGSSRGWFNESSVQYVVYSLYVNRGASSGYDFSALYDTLINGHRTNRAFTSIYSFSSAFFDAYPESSSRLATLLTSQGITSSLRDEFDSTRTETNFGGVSGISDVYRAVATNSSTATRMCATGATGSYNKLFNRRFFYFNVDSSGSYRINAHPADSSGDPVLVVYQQGEQLGATDDNGAGTDESITTTLSPGVYVGEVFDNSFYFGTSTASECYDVTVMRQ